jgi:hypothetical protein
VSRAANAKAQVILHHASNESDVDSDSDSSIGDDAASIACLRLCLQQHNNTELVELVATINFVRKLQKKAMRRGDFELRSMFHVFTSSDLASAD